MWSPVTLSVTEISKPVDNVEKEEGKWEHDT